MDWTAHVIWWHCYPLGFVNADGLQLPFADDTFDAVTISYGLRNVEDTLAALTEMRRVTRPGGAWRGPCRAGRRCGVRRSRAPRRRRDWPASRR